MVIVLYVINQKPLNIFSSIAQLLLLHGTLSEMPLDGWGSHLLWLILLRTRWEQNLVV